MDEPDVGQEALSGVPRPPLDQALWQGWIDTVCAAVGVDPESVDVAAIHDLSGQVAADFTRPMAPVAAHLAGFAHGLDQRADPLDVRRAIMAAARPIRA